jgi:3-dehydroquinate synthase
MLRARKNDIIHATDILKEISDIIAPFSNEKILLLTDHNCKKHCFPLLENAFQRPIDILSLQPGEKNKTISNVIKIWNFLSENNFSKKSLMINIGGGMVTDIGGFAASTYKRGLSFVNVPTSLLAQVDASVGGKNGINFRTVKNSIGTINPPLMVLISPIFLKTLNKREFLSGYSEMIKHALIHDRETYDELMHYILNQQNEEYQLQKLIRKSVEIKSCYVESDIYESGPRKILNFGHTFGHAFESLSNDPISRMKKMKHGEAVAFGMLCSLYLSVLKTGFPDLLFRQLKNDIYSIYGHFKLPELKFHQIFELMKKDKKNNGNRILMVLLKALGEPVYDISVSELEIYNTLNFLNSKEEKT